VAAVATQDVEDPGRDLSLRFQSDPKRAQARLEADATLSSERTAIGFDRRDCELCERGDHLLESLDGRFERDNVDEVAVIRASDPFEDDRQVSDAAALSGCARARVHRVERELIRQVVNEGASDLPPQARFAVDGSIPQRGDSTKRNNVGRFEEAHHAVEDFEREGRQGQVRAGGGRSRR
jgi:hypothetical protein